MCYRVCIVCVCVCVCLVCCVSCVYHVCHVCAVYAVCAPVFVACALCVRAVDLTVCHMHVLDI